MPKDLLEGLRHFRDTDLPRYRRLYERLTEEGQRPDVLFVSCSDSRIAPNLLTGTGPGDLFIVRTIGNIVAAPEAAPPDAAPDEAHAAAPRGLQAPDATAAAVEFSVAALGVREIVVCGHSACGAMKALYDGIPSDLPHLAAWVEQARPAELEPTKRARCRDSAERDRLTAQRNVLLSLDRLAAHPLVAERRASRDLILHGWYYDIATAEVRVLNPATGDFETPAALLA